MAAVGAVVAAEEDVVAVGVEVRFTSSVFLDAMANKNLQVTAALTVRPWEATDVGSKG